MGEQVISTSPTSDNQDDNQTDKKNQDFMDHSTLMKIEGGIHTFIEQEMEGILKNKNTEIEKLQKRIKVLVGLLIAAFFMLSGAFSWFTYDLGVKRAQQSVNSPVQPSYELEQDQEGAS